MYSTQLFGENFIFRETNQFKMKNILILFIFGLSLVGCSNDDDDSETLINCDFDTSMVLISEEQFDNAASDPLTINSLVLDNDNLTINFSASGCDGNSWELKLIDSENVFESNPPQRNLRLSLRNEELCQAFITRELTFDISNLQVDGNQVVLNVTNSDDSVLYEY